MNGFGDIHVLINPNSLDNKGSCWILLDFYCSVTMLRELGVTHKVHKNQFGLSITVLRLYSKVPLHFLSGRTLNINYLKNF